ncbi:MAG: hypothetical protein Q9186_004932 [Xanthomendoza sp. 1 TL-2023]
MWVDPPQRELSHQHVVSLMNIVLASALQHVHNEGNTLIPDDEPLEFASRGIKFCIDAYRGVAETADVAGHEDDVRLRWADIRPIILTFRAKMVREAKLFGPGSWRELAARILMNESEISLGEARLVDDVNSLGDPHKE